MRKKQRPVRRRRSGAAKQRALKRRSVRARARRVVASRTPKKRSVGLSQPPPAAPVLKPLFSKGELQQFRRLLLAQKVNLAGGIQQIAKGASKSQRETAGDLSTYTYHMADVASDTYDRELSLNIASTEQKVLYQIEEALKRVEDGSYGRCLDCNRPVPQTRLRAVPYAALCIGCQRQREDKRK